MNLLRYKSKNNYVNIFILGLITAFFIFLPFIIFDKGLFLYFGDFDVQQIPFYQLAHDAIRSGNTAWNWNTDLGANFVGSYSFYLLGSPFFWITLLFPSAAVPYLMAPLLMLKFALTAVTGYAYISRFTKYRRTAMIGALMYAFSGFNIYNIFFNHFNEAVMVFPLLLIALEELVINNRRGGFALTVALCAIINYYFFFGQVIFVVIYFLFRCRSKDFKMSVKIFFTIALESVIGLLMSAVLLLPSLLAILGNPRTGETLLGYDMLFYGNPQRYGLILSSFFFPPDIPARPNFFPNSNAKWSSVSMYLPMLSTIGLFAFFKNSKKHWTKPLLLTCFGISMIPILNSVFSAFNYAYYARWFYMPLLVMTMISCLSLEGERKHIKFGIIVTATITAAFALIGVLPKKVDDKIKFFSLVEYPERLWAYVAIAFIGILVVALLYNLTFKHKSFMKVAIVSVMAITVLYSTFMIYTGKLAGEGYDVVATKALYGREKMTLPTDEFYRIDTYGELDNLGMYWGIPTINAFQSVVPPSIMEYYESIGEERGVGSRPKPENIGIRALTSVRFSFRNDSVKPSDPMLGFEFLQTQNGYHIFENQHFIPMGFTYDSLMTPYQFETFPKQYKDRALLEGLLLSQSDYDKYKNLLPTVKNENVEDSYLGETDNYFAACDKLAANAATDFGYDKDGFTAKIDSAKANLLFFSVPYDKGWTATVNDNAVEIVKANNGFMAVPVPQGGSVVSFEYHTPGLLFGVIITLFAIVLFICYMLFIHRLRQWDSAQYGYKPHRHLLLRNIDIEIEAHEAYIEKQATLPDDVGNTKE